MNFLLVDFGTTSTKSALVDVDSGIFSHLRRHAALPALRPVAGRHEVDLAAIGQRFEQICQQAWAEAPFDGIVLCSEMHGFVLLDPDGKPLTQYISWLDARVLEAVDGAVTLDAIRARLPDDSFRRITGMRPRPGFPLLNLIHCARTMSLPECVTVVSLPAWLAAGGTTPAPEHPTMLAGMALFDVVNASWAQDLLEVAHELGGTQVQVGEPAQDSSVAGQWQGPGGAVPIYAGVGDHQCSVLGAGVTGSGSGSEAASVNLGTGSQVGIVDGPLNDTVEHRPFFDNRHLSAVTHIPAGRALSEFVGFLQQAAVFARPSAADAPATEPPDVWRALSEVSVQQVADATLDLDLAIFEGARGWHGGGSIGNIAEGDLTPQHYLASLLKAFASQYVDVLNGLDPDRRVARVALSGGIARNLPQLAPILANASGRQVDGATDLDESLLGLRALALHCAGKAPTVAAAQALFGRTCQLAQDATS